MLGAVTIYPLLFIVQKYRRSLAQTQRAVGQGLPRGSLSGFRL